MNVADGRTRGAMSGRRSHSRIRFSDSNGVLRITRDVTVRRGSTSELVAVSSQAGVVGDVMTIALGPDDRSTATVRVIDTRPVMVDGLVKYELRLAPAEADADPRTR
jgi:hypothetical protein